MSVLTLQEYEFEKQFNENEAIQWMQENWKAKGYEEGGPPKRIQRDGDMHLREAEKVLLGTVWQPPQIQPEPANETLLRGPFFSQAGPERFITGEAASEVPRSDPFS
ncbi:UNVERIFIED_CONTAM: hypothetical protein K2H54_035219 [Gekko kuhli]